jgi:hypothetical protein
MERKGRSGTVWITNVTDVEKRTAPKISLLSLPQTLTASGEHLSLCVALARIQK